MWNKIDAIALSTLLGAFFVWFVAFNSSIAFNTGLGSADDGYHALVAKYVANGEGYGSPISSNEIQPFGPDVGVGPALILPGAAATYLVGARDWLPGLLTLAIFCLQAGIVGVLLARRFGARASAAAGLMALLGISLVSATGGWFFGSFLGEAPAFGWLLLGAALLTSERTIAVALAGLCFALASLTKQMAIFASGGLILGWLIVSLSSRDLGRVARQSAVMLISFATPLVIWEITKLIAVGPAGYISYSQAAAHHGVVLDGGGLRERVAEFLATFQTAYGSPLILSALALTSIVAACIGPKRKELARLVVPLWFGVAAHFAYIIFLAPLWTRYFWIGVALAFSAAAAPLLVIRPIVRASVIAAALTACLALGLYQPVIALQRWAHDSDLADERRIVLRQISERGLPLAGQNWTSFFDILYLADDIAEWVQERDLVGRLQGRDFLAILNDGFTSKDGTYGKFYQSVSGQCAPLVALHRYSLFLCGKTFWDGWMSENSSKG